MSSWLNSLKSVFIIIVFSFTALHSQEVSTFLTGNGLNGPDGFALDKENNLYVANWGGGSGTTVLKITPEGNVSVYADGMSAPDGLVFDHSGNLYVSNFASGEIKKVSPSGEITVFASGLNHPSALVFDNEENLYVSNHGNANGTTVSKITSGGIVSVFSDGMNAPVGLAFDASGNLYVSNYGTGIINKITPDGTSSVFASIPNSPRSFIQYLVFDKNGNLYCPSYGHNKIYKITPAGEVSVFAGTGVTGGTDGPAATARFSGPNSLALTPEGDMFVSEYNTNRIRKITGLDLTSIKNGMGSLPANFELMQNYPNPFNPETNIEYTVKSGDRVILKIYNMLGKEIQTLVDEEKSPGKYRVRFEASLAGNALPSGVYFYKLACGNNYDVKKAQLIR